MLKTIQQCWQHWRTDILKGSLLTCWCLERSDPEKQPLCLAALQCWSSLHQREIIQCVDKHGNCQLPNNLRQQLKQSQLHLQWLSIEFPMKLTQPCWKWTHKRANSHLKYGTQVQHTNNDYQLNFQRNWHSHAENEHTRELISAQNM